MKHSRLATFLTLLILLAAGCAGMAEPAPTQEIVPGPTETAPTVTATVAATFSPTPNRYKTLSAANDLTATVRAMTPTPTLTATPTITPTFDFSRFQTNTPATAARCPQAQPGIAPTPVFYDSENYPIQTSDIIEYLNLYGPQSLISFYQHANSRFWTYWIMGYNDYTNDGVRELAFNLRDFFIFGCKDGEYALLYQLKDDGGFGRSGEIIQVLDANRNSVPEISLLGGFASQGSHNYLVIEWDGSQFNSVLDNTIVQATGDFGSEDIDRDGYPEYVAHIGIPVWETYRYGVPWRNEKVYFRWNGEEFLPYKRLLSPPEYRFQAVQDGDQALLYGEVDRALDFFRQVIYNDRLGWWSPERDRFLQEVFFTTISNDYPTPIAPTSDPAEYDNLAAYARFKLMVIYVSRGWHADAKIMFDNIQRLYPEDKVGHPYAELAAIIWNEYESSRSIAAGCKAANDFASSHEKEILYYIQGAGGFASNRINYSKEPWYICPFQ